MSAGGARRGRRDNGLDATDFAVAGDVDPRVGEHLLDVLAASGIAAYLQPSADLNPITRTTTLPARPTDRLFVDRAHLAIARDYMSRLAEDGGPTAPRQSGRDSAAAGPPEPPPDPSSSPGPDIEAEWARIIAGFNSTVDPTASPWPAAENVDPGPRSDPTREPDRTREPDPAREPDPVRPADRGGPTGTVDPQTPHRRRATDHTDPEPVEEGGEAHRLPSATDFSGISVGYRPPDRSLLDGLDTFGADLPDDDERYTPPPPPPLPRISKYAVLGILALLFGAVVFLFPRLLPTGRDVATLIGFTAILTGFVTLIWRLRPGDDEDDPDDGAVV